MAVTHYWAEITCKDSLTVPITGILLSQFSSSLKIAKVEHLILFLFRVCEMCAISVKFIWCVKDQGFETPGRVSW